MTKTFKPQLCPNEQVDLNTLKYPLLASAKLDGIRCIIKDGQLYSRSLKLIRNVHLRGLLSEITAYSKAHDVILDGELYCFTVPFNELSGIIRSDDKELPIDLKFWCFDILDGKDRPFVDRIKQYEKLNFRKLQPCVQYLASNAEEVQLAFEQSIRDGFEGLILRNPESKYKFGRARVKENIAYKVKLFETFDAKITGVVRATKVDENAEKTINELGYSVTSQKKDDRIFIDKACAFIVMHNGKELKVVLAMTDEEKKEIWLNKHNYIGKTIEYKGMTIGSKDLPRHPVMIRYRKDKDEDN
jgi:DNA ligase 1